MGPIKYIQSLPSKNIRGLLLEALNYWFSIPTDILDRIEGIISSLHDASLLLDDIEDQSPLRRGQPAAYCIFGHAQTINSANYVYVKAVEAIYYLKNDESHQAFLGTNFIYGN